ncbi:hypothetical protein KJ969_04790 [Patescibacteria group bacterium]|nr:hypothetical protein [Patescibacteria group bacterium]MBU1921651.1 hypothetical protein [Patescibacteria group bacterium]
MLHGEKTKKPEIGPKIELPPELEEFESKPEREIQESAPEAAPSESERPAPAPRPTPAPAKKDQTTAAIEKILEQDLGGLYIKLDPETKRKFRQEGDIVVGKIRTMFQTLKFKTRKILRWIREWLTVIPGVNKYFLEQEAKIKTDQILALAEEEKKKRQGLL